MMSLRAARLGAILGFLGLQGAPGFALENIKWGTINVHPYLAAEEHYEDNIYLVPKGTPKTGSWVNVVSPGLFLQSEAHPRYQAHLDLRATFLSYSKQSDQNNDFERTALADFTYKFPRNSSVKIYNNFQRTSDQAESEFTQRAKRIQNDAGLVADMNLIGRLGMTVDGQQTLHRYQDDLLKPGLDRTEYLGGGGIFYKVFPQTRLLLQYHYDQINYVSSSNPNDSQTHSAGLGVRGQISPKIVGTISGGGQWRSYNQDIPNAPLNARTGYYDIQAVWTPSAITVVRIVGDRSFQESVFVSNRYYVADALVLEIDHALGIKWKLAVQGRFEYDNYPIEASEDNVTADRIDKNIQGGFDLSYDIQPWISVGVHELFRQRLSNFPFDFKDNIAGVAVKLKL